MRSKDSNLFFAYTTSSADESSNNRTMKFPVALSSQTNTSKPTDNNQSREVGVCGMGIARITANISKAATAELSSIDHLLLGPHSIVAT